MMAGRETSSTSDTMRFSADDNSTRNDLSESPFDIRPFSSGDSVEQLFNFSRSSSLPFEAANVSELATSPSGARSVNTRAATTNTIASEITNQSHTSSSATLPFPFYGRPGLPNVDEFVVKSKLTYNHLRMMNMYEKKAMILKAYPPSIQHKQNISSVPEHSKDGSSLDHRVYGAVGGAHKRAVTPMSPLFGSHDHGQSAVDEELSFTRQQVKLFVKFVIYFSESDATSPAYQGITYADIENAFRVHQRTSKATETGSEDTHDLMMACFEDLLDKSGLTYITWFQRTAMQTAGNEPKVTAELFNKSIRSMCAHARVPVWSNAEMRMLRLYLSPDGHTEPTMTGIMRGFRKFYSTVEDRRIVSDAEPVVAKLKHIMTKRKLRIVDFFRAVQHDVTAAISPRKLVNAIEIVTRLGVAIPPPSPSHSRAGSPYQSALSPTDAGLGSESLAHLNSASALSRSLSLAADRSPSPSQKRSIGSAAKRAKAKLDPLPPDIVRRLQQREKEAQMALYKNGTKYCVAKSQSISRKLTMAHSLLQSPEGQDSSPKSAKSPSSAALLEASLREQSAEKAAAASKISGKPLPSHAALTLSDSFHAHAKKRTAELIKSFAQYDRKRVQYTKRLNAFF